MNLGRRGFMKAAGGAALAVVPGASAAARLSAPEGLLLGAGAGGMAGAAAQLNVTAIPMGVAGLMWRRLGDAEEKRAQWYALWREHRIRVRKHLENRQTAKFVWCRAELSPSTFRCGTS